jgi:hypothetical protein
MIRDFFEWFVQFLGFAPDPRAEVFPFASQLILATFAAVLAWLLVHNGQRRAAQEARRLERARFLHELDAEYAELMARRCVAKGKFADKTPNERVDVDENTLWLFEYALTEAVVWFEKPRVCDPGNPSSPRRYIYVNGARHLEVAEGVSIDTLTLHRALAWSSRAANGLRARIIDPTDVLNMWRHILPLAKNRRFQFLAAFFGVSQPVGLADEQARPLGELFANLFRRSPVRRGVPANWSGDIAPLYVLVRTVIAEALAQGRREVLDYARLIQRPAGVRLDPDPKRSALPLDEIVLRGLFNLKDLLEKDLKEAEPAENRAGEAGRA